MPKGHWMSSVSVAEPEAYKRYIAASNEAFEKYGARFLARGGRYTGPECSVGNRNVIIEFDSYEAALACYHSVEYAEALRHRLAASTAHIVIVEGIE